MPPTPGDTTVVSVSALSPEEAYELDMTASADEPGDVSYDGMPYLAEGVVALSERAAAASGISYDCGGGGRFGQAAGRALSCQLRTVLNSSSP